MVPPLWPEAHTGAVCKPESAPLGLLGWYLETFHPPDPLHPLVVYSPPLPLQHGSHPAVPITPVPTFANRTNAILRASSSSATLTEYLCVARGCESARQARRSEMPYPSCTNSTHRRRRAGLRSFHELPPSRSGCPPSGRPPLSADGRSPLPYPAIASPGPLSVRLTPGANYKTCGPTLQSTGRLEPMSPPVQGPPLLPEVCL